MSIDINIDQMPTVGSEREMNARELVKKVLSHPKTVNALSKLPGLVLIKDDENNETQSRNFGKVDKKTLSLNISSIFGVQIKMADAAVKTANTEGRTDLYVTNADALSNEKEVYKRLGSIAGLPKLYELGKGNEVWMEWLEGKRLDEKYREGGISFDRLKEFLQFASSIAIEIKGKGIVMAGIEPHNIMEHKGRFSSFDHGFDYVVDKPLKFFRDIDLKPRDAERQSTMVTLDTAAALVIGVYEYNKKRIDYLEDKDAWGKWVSEEMQRRLDGKGEKLAQLCGDVVSQNKTINFEELHELANS